MTEEAKAAAKVKRDAKKAAAAGGAPVSASEESDDAASVAPPAAPAPPPPAKAFGKKVVGATAAKPAYTLEQLSDFTPKDVEGEECGVNCRGDVVDGDGNYIGHWNSKTSVLSRSSARPADWDAILGAMNA